MSKPTTQDVQKAIDESDIHVRVEWVSSSGVGLHIKGKPTDMILPDNPETLNLDGYEYQTWYVTEDGKIGWDFQSGEATQILDKVCDALSTAMVTYREPSVEEISPGVYGVGVVPEGAIDFHKVCDCLDNLRLNVLGVGLNENGSVQVKVKQQ